MSDNLSQVSGTHQERAHRHAPRETPPPLLNGVYPLFVSSPSSSDTVPSHARPMAAPSRSQLSGSQNVRLHRAMACSAPSPRVFPISGTARWRVPPAAAPFSPCSFNLPPPTCRVPASGPATGRHPLRVPTDGARSLGLRAPRRRTRPPHSPCASDGAAASHPEMPASRPWTIKSKASEMSSVKSSSSTSLGLMTP